MFDLLNNMFTKGNMLLTQKVRANKILYCCV